MTMWNYRVVREGEADDIEFYHLAEVYYDADGHIRGWSSSSPYAYGDSIEDLQEDLRCMMAAIDRPVLRAEELPGAHK